MTREGIEADLNAFLARAREDEPQLEAELRVDHWLPPCEIADDDPLVAALRAASAETLGAAPPLAGFPGGTDAPYFQLACGIPTVPSFGPGLLTAAHRPDESLSLASLLEAASIYAGTARRYLGGAVAEPDPLLEAR
jgi:acetylornithine deacetylase